MLYAALLATHRHIRRELAGVEQLSVALLDGLPPEELQERLEELRGNSMLWQFQVTCLRYCALVHMHHNAEDADFFDELEQTNPALSPVVERLRSDHRAVSDLLDSVEDAVRTLTNDESLGARLAVAEALEALKAHLLTHLDYEERNVEATTRRLRDFASS
jgi:hypothetical protein